MSSLKNMAWIPCSERMPQDGQNVAFIVHCPGDSCHGRILGGRFNTGEFGGFSCPGLSVLASHWMPLPGSPSEPQTTAPRVPYAEMAKFYWEPVPKGAEIPEGAQMLDAQWVFPVFGCDSLDWTLDAAHAEIRKILAVVAGAAEKLNAVRVLAKNGGNIAAIVRMCEISIRELAVESVVFKIRAADAAGEKTLLNAEVTRLYEGIKILTDALDSIADMEEHAHEGHTYHASDFARERLAAYRKSIKSTQPEFKGEPHVR